MATILLAEDSDSMRALIAAALRQEGHEVIEAADGAAAIHLLGQRRFDLVVSDLFMPKTDGFGVLAAVAQLTPRPPVIAISAPVRTLNMLRAARLLGASVTIEKPFPMPVFLGHVAALLDPSRNSAPVLRPFP